MSLDLSGKEFEEIREGFKQIDKDSDGFISLPELRDGFMGGKYGEEEATDFYMKMYDLKEN